MKTHNTINVDDDFDFSWATNFSERMAEFGERMAKLGEKMSDSSNITFQNSSIQGDTQMVTINGKTTIKKGNTKITIDEDGNVTVNGKKVEKEEKRKPKYGDLEKLVDIPKIDDPDLFRTNHGDLEKLADIPKIDDPNLFRNLETKLGGRIDKLLVTVIVIGIMTLTTLVSVCLSL